MCCLFSEYKCCSDTVVFPCLRLSVYPTLSLSLTLTLSNRDAMHQLIQLPILPISLFHTLYAPGTIRITAMTVVLTCDCVEYRNPIGMIGVNLAGVILLLLDVNVACDSSKSYLIDV